MDPIPNGVTIPDRISLADPLPVVDRHTVPVRVPLADDVTSPHDDVPFPQWSPVRLLARDGADFVRCSTCSGVVLRVDAAAHLDWHRATSDRIGQIARRLDDAVAALSPPGGRHLTGARPARDEITTACSTMSIVRDALIDLGHDLRAG